MRPVVIPVVILFRSAPRHAESSVSVPIRRERGLRFQAENSKQNKAVEAPECSAAWLAHLVWDQVCHYSTSPLFSLSISRSEFCSVVISVAETASIAARRSSFFTCAYREVVAMVEWPNSI